MKYSNCIPEDRTLTMKHGEFLIGGILLVDYGPHYVLRTMMMPVNYILPSPRQALIPLARANDDFRLNINHESDGTIGKT